MEDKTEKKVPENANAKSYQKIGQGTYEGTLYKNVYSQFQPSYNLVSGNIIYNITGTPARQLEELKDKVAGHRIRIVLEERISPRFRKGYYAITRIENLSNGNSKKQLELVGFDENTN
jgi:hypothetical protein